jgi:hypothetical protein
MKELIKLIQKKVGVIEDGDAGPITWRAIANALGVVVDPVKSGNKVIDIALKEHAAGVYETSKNQGPGIEKYWTATNYTDGYKNREPWCAAFICWILKESGLFTEIERPKTAAAFGFENWADNLSSKVKIVRKPTLVTKGDIVIFSFSHIAIATSDSDKDGDFTTVEGNTNPAGSREGNGVYKKTRNLSVVRSKVTIK